MEAGAWGCVISGAGPSLLALAPEAQAQDVGLAMVAAWEASGVTSRHAVLGLQQSGSAWTALPSAEDTSGPPAKRQVGAAEGAANRPRSRGRQG